jgi:SAM-dependent methyltransferase
MTRKPPCYHDDTIRRRLRDWFGQPLGRLVLEAERAQLQDIMPNLYGYHAMQLGSLGEDTNLLAAGNLPHPFVADSDCLAGPRCAGVFARPDALPIESDSLAALLLPHTLEFEIDPHGVLREAERVVFPEGRVVILGFNPWSLWGLWRLVLRGRGEVPWCGRFLSPTRVKDWLALLGFETVCTKGLMFRPPLQHERLMRKLGFLERPGERWWPYKGGCYILVAKKKVVRLTPIRPRWRRRSLVPGRLIEPTRRDLQHDRR